jgi:CheY-like chemotaxis protein
MRKLRLDDVALGRLLNELDAQEMRVEGTEPRPDLYFSYRIPGLRVDLDVSRDESDSLIAPSRKLGAHGIYFLVGNLVHANCTCRIHLVTVRNNWQTVNGTVERCRYLPGTTGVHEVFVRFQRPIDPASFAPAATRARILAADDSRVSLKLYERLLDTLNVDLTCVSSGIEAVERAVAGNYDLVLMDVEMPGMDGLTAVRMLRDKGYVRAIVVVSAMSSPEDRERCLSSGCDDFLGKPLTRETLASVVYRNRSEPLVSAMLDDPAMVDLIDGFVLNLTEAIASLEAAYGSRNLDELARQARAIKGEAAGVGFGSITDAASVVESAAKRGDDMPTIRGKLTELIRLCMAARPATSRTSEEVGELADGAHKGKPGDAMVNGSTN